MLSNDLLGVIDEVCINCLTYGIPVRLAPRSAILETLVIHLVDSCTMVTVGFEVLRQRNAVGLGCAEVSHQVPHLRRVWPQTGHDRRARGTAYRLLAVRFAEHDAASRNAIDVRRSDELVAVTAEFRSKVIDCDEQHVGSVSRLQRDAG